LFVEGTFFVHCTEGVVVGQNFIPSSSRPSTLAAAVAQAHHMANTQLIGMAVILLLSGY